MSLSRDFKRAFARNFNEESSLWAFPAGALAFTGAMYAGGWMHEDTSTQPTAPMTQQEQKVEQEQLKTLLGDVATEYEKFHKADKALDAAQAEIERGKNIPVARQAFIAAQAGQMQARFALDDKVTDFSAYALMKTRLPEQLVVDAVNAQSGLPSSVSYSFRFRDEARKEVKGLESMSPQQAVERLKDDMWGNAFVNNVLTVGAFVGGGALSGLGFLVSLLSGAGGLRQRFQQEIDREEAERRRQEREVQKKSGKTAAPKRQKKKPATPKKEAPKKGPGEFRF